jgi:hypothetical protein
MPRVEVPWYQWRASGKDLAWVAGSAGALVAASLLIRSGSSCLGFLLFPLSVVVLLSRLPSIWRNRNPFVFAYRGHRNVVFRGKERDKTIFEEDGRRAIIHTEMLFGKINCAIYASSIQKDGPEHDDEPLTEQQKEDILDLLCEDYDYRGVTYDVIMTSHLSVRMPCPRCGEEQDFEIGLPFGRISERSYRIGDRIEWRPGRPASRGGRPDHGNLRESVWAACPTCRRDCWLLVTVTEDRIERIDIDPSKPVEIPDDSIPILDNGKVGGK